jgi:hypothetical protein
MDKESIRSRHDVEDFEKSGENVVRKGEPNGRVFNMQTLRAIHFKASTRVTWAEEMRDKFFPGESLTEE